MPSGKLFGCAQRYDFFSERLSAPDTNLSHFQTLSDQSASPALRSRQHHNPKDYERDRKDKADHWQNNQPDNEQQSRSDQKENADGSA
jgi:hypothetical protein